jgi:uncharacterized membrane protein YphA (DoxX/SURF4 family)
VRRDPAATRVAILTGFVLVPAGLVTFAFHHWELHAFQSFGLPWPSTLEILAGVLELAGGVLLIARRLVVPAALLLAFTMIVAIGASGVGHGDVIPSLTLAPALLLALIFLLSRALRPRTRQSTIRHAYRKGRSPQATPFHISILIDCPVARTSRPVVRRPLCKGTRVKLRTTQSPADRRSWQRRSERGVLSHASDRGRRQGRRD